MFVNVFYNSHHPKNQKVRFVWRNPCNVEFYFKKCVLYLDFLPFFNNWSEQSTPLPMDDKVPLINTVQSIPWWLMIWRSKEPCRTPCCWNRRWNSCHLRWHIYIYIIQDGIYIYIYASSPMSSLSSATRWFSGMKWTPFSEVFLWKETVD